MVTDRQVRKLFDVLASGQTNPALDVSLDSVFQTIQGCSESEDAENGDGTEHLQAAR